MSGRRRRAPPTALKSVQSVLIKLVEDAGSQASVADALGLSRAHLCTLLNGGDVRGPGVYTLLKLRELTGRSIDDLLGLEPPRSEHRDVKPADWIDWEEVAS